MTKISIRSFIKKVEKIIYRQTLFESINIYNCEKQIIMSYQQTFEHYQARCILKTLCKQLMANLDIIGSDLNETATLAEQVNWILQAEAKKAAVSDEKGSRTAPSEPQKVSPTDKIDRLRNMFIESGWQIGLYDKQGVIIWGRTEQKAVPAKHQFVVPCNGIQSTTVIVNFLTAQNAWCLVSKDKSGHTLASIIMDDDDENEKTFLKIQDWIKTR